MSAQELAGVLKFLKENGPDLGVPPPQARANFEVFIGKMPIAADLTFTPADAGGVPGLWIDAPGARQDRVLLYYHGGAYVVGSAHGYRSLAGEFGRAAGARSLAIDYRLAPEHPFPAGVDDALSAYRWLLGRGVSPKSIVFGGDSAGGGICMAVLMAARKARLPLPAAALLICPWLDLDCSGASVEGKKGADPSFPIEGLEFMATLYRGTPAAADPDGLLTPLQADLSGLPPLLIQVGSAELLLDDSTRLATRAAADDVAVRLEVWPNMVHDWHMFAPILGEGRDAIATAGAFLKARMEAAG